MKQRVDVLPQDIVVFIIMIALKQSEYNDIDWFNEISH